MGMGPWQAERMRLRGKKRETEETVGASRAGHRSPWSQAGESRGRDVPGVRRSETTVSPSGPQTLRGKGELCTQKKG